MRAACRLISEEFEWWTARWQRRRMRFWPLTASIMSWEEAGKRLCLGSHLTLLCCLHRHFASFRWRKFDLKKADTKNKRLGTTADSQGRHHPICTTGYYKAVLLFWAQTTKIWRWSRGHGHLQRDWFYCVACKKNQMSLLALQRTSSSCSLRRNYQKLVLL